MANTRLHYTTLTQEDFLKIPSSLVLKIFDVGSAGVWRQLPESYRRLPCFIMESWCYGHWDEDNIADGPVTRKKNCKVCLPHIAHGRRGGGTQETA